MILLPCIITKEGVTRNNLLALIRKRCYCVVVAL